MSALDTTKPNDRLAALLAPKLSAVNALIAERMASKHAPRIPQVTAHLVAAGGKRLRPMLTLASAMMCGYKGPFDIHLAATVEFIHTATLLHDDVVDESTQRIFEAWTDSQLRRHVLVKHQEGTVVLYAEREEERHKKGHRKKSP